MLEYLDHWESGPAIWRASRTQVAQRLLEPEEVDTWTPYRDSRVISSDAPSGTASALTTEVATRSAVYLPPSRWIAHVIFLCILARVVPLLIAKCAA